VAGGASAVPPGQLQAPPLIPPNGTTADPSPEDGAGPKAKTSAAVEPGTPEVGLHRKHREGRTLKPLRFRVDLGPTLSFTTVSDSGYYAFDDGSRLVGGGAFVRADGSLAKGVVFLGGGISYHGFRTDRQILGALSNSLVIHEPLVHARLSLRPIEGVDPFLDLAAGPSIQSVDVSNGAEPTISDQQVRAAVSAMGGFVLYLPRAWLPGAKSPPVTAGLEFAAGYQYRQALAVDANPEVDDDAIPIEGTSFGDVTMSGFTWSLAFILRVM